jgi:non-reducing end alpha-L-arabinofuranosidase
MRTKNFWNELALVAVLGASCLGCKITADSADGAVSSTGGSGGAPVNTRTCTGTPTPTTTGPTGGPCDIYAADNGACIAAHSMVRALYAAYDGPLYQVKKTLDGTTKDIGVLTAGGYANAADQDGFCGTDACTVSIIYDQTGMGNNLTKAPAGGAKTTPDNEANAKSAPATFNGHAVYGIHIVPGVG